MRRVKALSVHQGWAWGLVWGPKRIENRGWPTRYRGRLLIHASKGRASLPFARRAMPGMPADEDLDFGAIVGSVTLVDCVPILDALGMPFAEGPWCWITRDPEPLGPYPYRGMQGLFDVDLEELRRLHPAIERAGKLF